jgi:hypothetical protein
VLAGLLAGSAAVAVTLERFTLDKMCGRAETIFRGTVLTAVPSRMDVGGGVIPTVLYTVRVDEAFKGDFEETKGVRLVEIRMLGKSSPTQVGDALRFPALPAPPSLSVGSDYLLFSSPASKIGLSATIGLGQGCFEILEKDGIAHAVNGFDNAGLFSADKSALAPAEGPVPYAFIAEQIRAELGR